MHHRLRLAALAALALCVATPALAVPGQMSHQGRVIDASGDAVEGSQSVSFALYAAASGGSAVWTETQDVDFDNGYFSATLGASTPIAASALASDELWLGIAIGSSPELSPRLRVASVPYALMANGVSGGSVDASEIKINGSTVIGSDGMIAYSAIAGAPDDTLAALACNAGELAIFDGAAWDCGTVDISSIPASAITSGQLDINRIPVGTTSGTVSAGDHNHDSAYAQISNVYTKAEVDAAVEAAAAFDPASEKAVPKAWTVGGASDACRDAAPAYATIPDLTHTFALDGDYTVLTLFSYNVYGNANGDWVATRLNVDGTPDRQETHMQQSGAGEDETVNLFRIDELGAGNHTIKAEWGQGSGRVCNTAGQDAGDNYDGEAIWTRRLTVLAIPKETGVKSAMVWGADEQACRPAAANWVAMPQMTSAMNLDKPSVVLSFFDFTGVGNADGSWVAQRITIDNNSDGGTHQQPQGRADEDDHYSIFQVNNVAAGAHTVRGEWGHGGNTMCVNSNDSRKIWGRRLGWIAIPTDTGTKALTAEARADYTQDSTAWIDLPGLSYETWVPPGQSYLALTQAHVTMNPNANGAWAGMRFKVDGDGELRSTHSQQTVAGEDDILELHRVDLFDAGSHTLRTQWRTNGSVSNNAGNTGYAGYVWSRRMATVMIPMKSYAE